MVLWSYIVQQEPKSDGWQRSIFAIYCTTLQQKGLIVRNFTGHLVWLLVSRWIARILSIGMLASVLAACGGGSSGTSMLVPSNEPTSMPTLAPSFEPTQEPKLVEPTAAPGDITISGVVSFDLVPHDSGGALNYEDITVEPAKFVTVVLLDDSDTVLRTSRTNDSGHYELSSPQNTRVRVIAQAEMKRRDTDSWHYRVVDNTASEAVYVLAGNLVDSGNDDSIRNLHAVSGWDSGANQFENESVRPAAPFAILNSAFEAMVMVVNADPNVQLPQCDFNWSVNNQAISGDIAEGFIGTSYYDPASGHIFVLGDANDDTDEYDFSVIQHEMGHFMEDAISRSDSIGGSHGLSTEIDMRVAFSEGFANAFTAIASNQQRYMDSSGSSQSGGFSFSLEENNFPNRGWYSENSIGKILYDVSDSDNEAGDDISLGYEAIHRVMVSPEFVGNDALSSIFLFSEMFLSVVDTSAQTAFVNLLNNENIHSFQRYGAGETNDGGLPSSLPVYKTLSLGDSIEVCSSNEISEYNGLGVGQFVRLYVPSSATVNFNIERTSGQIVTDPDARLYAGGVYTAAFDSSDVNQETASLGLPAGEYVVEIFEASNSDMSSDTGGETCFSVSAD